MADLSQARTRVVVGAAGAKVNSASQFAGKNPAPPVVAGGKHILFPRANGTRKYGPRR